MAFRLSRSDFVSVGAMLSGHYNRSFGSANLMPERACSEHGRRFRTLRRINAPVEVGAVFDADPASAGAARRFVAGALRGWGCDDLADVATLLVSELVANAILHAHTSIHVLVRRQENGRVRVDVHDGADRAPARMHYSATTTTGRGLLLVETLASDWGVTPSEVA